MLVDSNFKLDLIDIAQVWVTLFAFLQFACLQTSRQEVEAKRIGECRPL